MSIQSCFRKIKPSLIVAWIIGTCPIKNVFGSVNAGPLQFKRCSIIYILSWFQLLLKYVGMAQTAFVAVLLEQSANYSSTFTDSLAQSVGFGMTFAFGLICQGIMIVRSGKLMSLLKSIDIYDDVYPISQQTKIMSVSIAHAIFNSIVMVFAPNLIMYKSIFSQGIRPKVLIFFFASKDIWIVLAYFSSLFAVTEFPATFLYIQILYLSSVMTHRLENLIGLVEGKSISSSHSNILLADQIKPREKEGFYGKSAPTLDSTKFAWNADKPAKGRNPFQPQFLSPEFSSKSWKAISRQYIDFQDLFYRFEDYIGLYFIVLYTCHIVSSVCMIYFSSNSSHPVFNTNHMSFIFNTVIGVGLIRIVSLADCGDAIEKKYNRLLRILMRVSQEDNFFDEEKKQFKRFLTVASTVPFRLSAVGFFDVSRQNLTSIVSVIITYIIVLQQFRSSEKSPSPIIPERNFTNSTIN